MTSPIVRATSRRRFLQHLAASPLFASGTLSAYGAEAPSKWPDPMIWAPAGGGELIDRPKDAINVFDFEPVARKNVPPAHFGYMASGLDDEVTLRANREGFLKFQLMPHRLNDVSKVDTSVELFGTRYDSPIFVCPTGGNQFFHPDGEVAVAKAARAGNHLQILSTSSNYSVEDVTEARGAPIWFQLYASPRWEVAQALIKRADAAGCPVLVVTVDRIAGRNQETLFRLMRTDTRECSACHDRGSFAARSVRRHNYDGIDLSGMPAGGESSNLSWDTFKRMRDITRMKIVLKGIVTPDDAELAVQNGIDGILVSNHGGRGEDNGRSTIDALPDIIAAVKGRMPVIVDSGFRRGTDAVKALAIGAQAVGIGRPYLWGLGAFGQEGVERVLEIVRTETRAAMQQCGARSVRELNPSFVRRAT
ncbi:alpha-hydroxy acid oxidase [Bradyrhizobium erythrophlei]|uniref:4-hydroxymandelate oxidase n=1 Tax=Bradyrhizobium erythrophlei TaxID=1437360 RepID=A0A1M5WLM4_9BRAD|nr:alpha-hydroxy acid oxidase [Bradyrhizobium erythrophlei]SHH88397.1 4-hydroxymandelate oxidase [Bradyrhizobium erythrophlei]